MNCDSNRDCPKWINKFENVGCYGGCSFDDHYRPTAKSIMLNYRKLGGSKDYGIVSSNELLRRLDHYK